MLGDWPLFLHHNLRIKIYLVYPYMLHTWSYPGFSVTWLSMAAWDANTHFKSLLLRSVELVVKQQNLWVNGEDSYISTVAKRNKLQSYLVCFQHSAFSTHSTQISSLKSPQYTHFSLLLCCSQNTIFWAMAMRICCLNCAGEVSLWLFLCCTLRFIHWCCYAWLHGRPHWLSRPTESWGWPYCCFIHISSTTPSSNNHMLP